ncbi:hypothetical protein [Gimesia sp.]|uniref:hypothetical protein n=1 Tax=Gimesia sp. TaxID=2024833 RepID=UPI0025B8CC82|nr:hypothetical protein [Gimesia sp.]
MVNIDDTFLILPLIFQWFGIFICGAWGVSFIMLCETGKGAVITFTVGQANGATR